MYSFISCIYIYISLIGVCILSCVGGCIHLRGPWPDFMDTLFDELPWKSPGPFTRILPQDHTYLPGFFRPDAWHTINLGMGRSWVANCLVLLLALFPASSVPNQLKAMSKAYDAFCSNSVSRYGITLYTC